MNSRIAVAVLAATACAVQPATVDAQTAEPATVALEEVLVTTRRREESLQTVPVAVTALTAEALQAQGVSSIEALASQVPGLGFYSLSGGGLGAPVIRGLSKTNTSGFENNVGVFFDNLFLDNNAILDTGFLDLERVEVAFGPQSALYGRNSFAGAVSYVPRNPPREFEGSARATVGTDSRYEAMLSLGGPIIEGRLHALASVGYGEFGGTIRNTWGGDDLGGWKNKKNGHAVIEFTPTEWLTARARYLGIRKSVPSDAKFIVAGQSAFNEAGVANNCGRAAGPGGRLFTTYCGTVPGVEAAAAHPLATGVESELDLLSLLAEIRGDAVTASLQHGRVDSDASGVVDGSLAANRAALVLAGSSAATGGEVGNRFTNPFVGPVDQRQWLFKISSTDDGPLSSIGGMPIQWLVGAEKYDAERTLNVVFYDLRGTGATLARTTTVQRSEEIDEWSYFARVAATLGDRFTISAEARRKSEEKCAVNVTDLRPLLPFLPLLTTNFGCSDFNATTPRLTLDYRIADDVMGYLSWAKGTKTGGFNSQVNFVAGEDRFDDEVNNTYEAGLKATWLDGRLRTNLAVYSIAWEDLQLTTSSTDPRNTNLIIRNVGAASSEGLELSTTWLGSERFETGVGVAYGNPTFDRGNADPSLSPLGFGTDISGRSLPRQSKLQLNGHVALNRPQLVAGFDASARLSASYRSGQYDTPLNLAKTEDVTFVNLRVTFQRGPLELSLWVDNVFDESYATTMLGNLTTAPETPAGTAFVGTRAIEVYVGNLRSAGLTATYRF